MKTYFLGTTLEGLTNVFNNTKISKGGFNDFLNLIPSKLKNETRKNLFTHAMQDADFAISELSHTKRVVLELKGLDESIFLKVTKEPNIYSIKYPSDIQLSNIKKIYIDKFDISGKIKEWVALTNLLLTQNSDFVKQLRDIYFSGKNIRKFNIPVKNIELIDLNSLFIIHEEDAHGYFYDLFNQIDNPNLFTTIKLKNIIKSDMFNLLEVFPTEMATAINTMNK